MYAVEVLPLTKTDTAMLNHLVDRAVYPIFACTSTEDVQFLRSVVDLPSLNSCLNDRLARFQRSFTHSFSWAAVMLPDTDVLFLRFLLTLWFFNLKKILSLY